MRAESVAVLLSCMLILPGCMASEENEIELYGMEYRDPPDAPDFTLFDQNGDVFTLSDFEGKVVVVAFIYTSCPDVCLIISANLDYAYQSLDVGNSEHIVFVSVTIDPARDTITHLAEWTEQMSYEWYHLTGPTSALQDTYRSWNVLVDNEHINASQPPENGTNRIAVLYPDNTTFQFNGVGMGLNGDDFAVQVFSDSNMSYDMAEGVIGDWQSDEGWSWVLHAWDVENETWIGAQEDISALVLDTDTHLAWAASNANLGNLPPGIDCNGHGWAMGSGDAAHCMCDEGYERAEGNWLSCVSEGTAGNEVGNETDPHEESLGLYEVGHSTVTFILDKQMRKRVAYSGINWDAGEFTHDVQALVDQ
ncbi:MAG: SCO family protein [Candidatus Thermoplasmatota archaeon]|nr:SCO family protein [Candidatus Thermoplasmatota archaeon]MEE3276942.1 SCO family protein [Candidatus Thermoplasmatota archaeon]